MVGVDMGDGLGVPFLQASEDGSFVLASWQLTLRYGFVAGWVRWYAGHCQVCFMGFLIGNGFKYIDLWIGSILLVGCRRSCATFALTLLFMHATLVLFAFKM